MEQPVLIFDGDCGFCRYWVRYWQRLTGDQVRYRPYQEVAADYPEVGLEAFSGAIKLDEPGRPMLSGAAAAFRVLALAGRPLGWRAYRFVPGFASISGFVYASIAGHRPAAARLSRWLWGAERVPATYHHASWLFTRVIALIFVTAFLSLAVQITALVGTDGILPLSEYLVALYDEYGAGAYRQVPTLFWLSDADLTLSVAAYTGALAAALVFFGFAPAPLLAVCFVLYLSLFYAGQVFTTFQWDLLLLESGFLAIGLRFGHPFVPWLFRWLLFRFMFLSGVVKLASGDAPWQSLTALAYHFETQPLPSPLAWYAHHLPEQMLRAGVLATFVVELLVPFLFFAPRRPRALAAILTVAFQFGILVTGSYNFFNLLTIALCLFLFEDRDLARLVPFRTRRHARPDPGRGIGVAVMTIGALVFALGAAEFVTVLAGRPGPAPVAAFRETFAPFRFASGYGVFAVMTTERHEIVIEGSRDQREWRPYVHRFKPGPPERMPGYNVPHQPRLDWQMWFAALGDADRNPWFGNLLVRLIENEPKVTALFAENPFPGDPPRYVRAMVYRYRFTTPAQRRETGAWWSRELEGYYYPPIQAPREGSRYRMEVTPWGEPRPGASRR